MITRIIKHLVCSFLFLMGVNSFAQPLPQFIHENIPCPYFDAIHSTGIINVEVIAGQPQQSVEVIGDPRLLNKFHYQVQNQTLMLAVKPTSALKQYCHTPQEYLTVRIKLKDLHEIAQAGYGSFSVSGTPIHLMRLDYSGSGPLKIYWVDNPALRLHASGSGTVTLAGVAGIVNMELFHNAHADLRFLRANTVFVKTYQRSVADVYPLINLFALADNHSDIYYYHKPKYLNQIMRESGSVLAMHDIPNALLTFDSSPM